MKSKSDALREYAKEKTRITISKVDKAIRELVFEGKQVNFNTVIEKAQVSKGFVYRNEGIRKRIEELREKQQKQVIISKKSDSAKDIVILAKDNKIKALEAEIRQLKDELAKIRGKFYDQV